MRRLHSAGILVIGILLIGTGAWFVLSPQQYASSRLEDITIDPGKGVTPTLLLVAKDKGFFEKNGLNVTFIESPSATVAIQNLLDQKNDFGYVNEYSLSEPQWYNKKLRVIATLSLSDTSSLVGRTDRGISRISDLEGKKIGVTKSSIVEYFMDRFFILNGLSLDNTTVVYLQPAALVDALASGDIDAAFSFEPYVYQMQQRMGGNVVVWPVNLGQHAHYSLIANDVTLTQKPEVVQGLLSSVLQAEMYANSHPEETRKIAQKQTNYDDTYMEQDWQKHQFSVGLSQSLIRSMEDESRWRIRNNLTAAADVPDFSNYLYPDALYRLNPASVTLIR